ncbi:amidohydrolase family protein [Pseudonocardia acaciae]|uniref:amidohydrolase family protein n=1 Tax=Pseudonocardia acaciae TaxID=551276 RepID=UPI00048D64C2|nr:amidohydrolase family protein [Pseudonocardia acaciae]
MSVVDIHTHMLSERYLELLTTRSDGVYRIRDGIGDVRVLDKGGAPFLTLTEGMFDYPMRIKEMDAAGVDLAVISLSAPNVYWGSADTSAEVARLTNDQLAAAQREHPDRIRFLASLPWQHPDRAVAELERAVGLGAVGVMVLGNVAGASLTEEAFAPVWSAIDRRGLPVLVHPTTPPGVEQMDVSRYHLVWSAGFTYDTTLALSRMILDGFFDRYRQLKIIGSHAGGYLPFLMPRLDQGFHSFASTRESIDRLPSSYLPQLYVDSIAYSEAALRFTVDTFGADHVLYGSDYPHKCGRMDQMLELLDAGTSGQATTAIRGRNAERLFAL